MTTPTSSSESRGFVELAAIANFKRVLLWVGLSAACAGALAIPFKSTHILSAQRVHRFDHVILVIEENKSFSTIIGNQDAPYINQLAKAGALFIDAHAVMHPSQPNYLALFAGTTDGIADDSCPHDLSGPNLASELMEKKLSFVIYSEDLPSIGFDGCSGTGGLYRRKHNPVVDFQNANVSSSANRPFKDFPTDYSKLPTLAFVVPNIMNDMHDGTIAEGDTWLKQHLDAYVQWAKLHNGLLIITWDESDANSVTNQIPTILVGEHVKPGKYRYKINHYNLLRTLSDMYGIKPVNESVKVSPLHAVW